MSVGGGTVLTMDIAGKTAVVTGAAVGIGRAIAARLGAAALDVNLRAPMLTTQLAIPGMRAAGGGAVVNVGSTAGVGFGPHVSPEYSAAKAALIRFTTTLPDLGGVRVNCVVPDWVATPRGIRERAALPPAERGQALVPLEAVTDAVVDFVADDSLAGRVVLLEREAEPRWLN